MPTTPEPDPPDAAEPPEALGIDTRMQPRTQIIPQVPHKMPFAYDQGTFDRWLRNELNSLHSSVLSEPIPQNLLDILQQPKPD
jgi:hypothetical protein